LRALLRIAAGIDRLNRALGAGVAWLTLVMVLVGALNALLRWVDGATGSALSSNAYIEAQWFLFSLVFLMGAARTLRANGHVRVDVLYGRLSARGKAWIDLVGGVLFLLPFCAFALIESWPYVLDSWQARGGKGEISPDPGGLLYYPIKAAILVAFALLALQGLSEIVKRAAFLRGWSAEEIGLEEPKPYADHPGVEGI
jgi:TRAP-type mannitol/chloroaromatic compound transport system permease small subunit